MTRSTRLEVTRNALFPLAKFSAFHFPARFTSGDILKLLGLPNDRLHQMFLASYISRRGFRKVRPLINGKRIWFWIAPPIPVVPAQEPVRVNEDPAPPPAATPSGDPGLAAFEAAARSVLDHPEIEIRLAAKAVLRTLDRIARRVSERKA